MVFARKYGKGIASLIVTVAASWLTIAKAGPVGVAEWFTIIGSVAATVAVVGIANTVTSPAIKAVAQVIGVVSTGVGALIAGGGLTEVGLIALLIQAVGIYGVYQSPGTSAGYTPKHEART